MPRDPKNHKIAFEQTVLRTLRSLEGRPNSILVGCSGGVDSIVLLEALWRVRNIAGVDLNVAYVHHGPGQGSRYRKQAWRLVREICKQKNLPFHSNSSDGNPDITVPVRGEAALRELRWNYLNGLRKQLAIDAIAVAHHYQDLLETRLLRLIRGTGAQGFASMRVFHGSILRPLLKTEKAAILQYARERKLAFLDDPSNLSPDPLRNWLRQWIAVLEKRYPGGARNIARSFEELAEQLAHSQLDSLITFMTESGIDRRAYLASARARRKASLAQYCSNLGLKNYTQGHIEELLRRLDDRQKHFKFELLNCLWDVSTERIQASRV